MGVYIKGMEMPTSCPCELLGIGYDLYCSFASGIPARVNEYYECCQNGTRPSWCPLVPVPQYGRLIDADALCEVMKRRDEENGGVGGVLVFAAEQCVEAAPTIIEEEDGY